MNPVVEKVLGSVIRQLLSVGGAVLVSKGILSEADMGDMTTAVAGSLMVILSQGWSLWEKRKARRLLLTALASPKPISENTALGLVSSGQAPSLLTARDTVPLEGFKESVEDSL